MSQRNELVTIPNWGYSDAKYHLLYKTHTVFRPSYALGCSSRV